MRTRTIKELTFEELNKQIRKERSQSSKEGYRFKDIKFGYEESTENYVAKLTWDDPIDISSKMYWYGEIVIFRDVHNELKIGKIVESLCPYFSRNGDYGYRYIIDCNNEEYFVHEDDVLGQLINKNKPECEDD